MLTAKEIDRLNALYDEAVDCFLDGADFNPSDCLAETEAKEYVALVKKDEE